MSICSIEDVAKATTKPFWFQLYVMRDRGFAADLIGRAKAAGCSALVLTLDLQILAQRHKDIKNGLSAPPKPTIANLINLAFKPALVPRHARDEKPHLRQHRRPCEGRRGHVVARRLDQLAVRPDARLGIRSRKHGPLNLAPYLYFIGAPLSGPSGGDCTLPRSVFLLVEQLYSDLPVLAPFSIPGVRRFRIAA
jgi:isopentenyl diphosphate isomerase/L-lactate dehydrogenase-like FMN-dependent dehydrogenase